MYRLFIFISITLYILTLPSCVSTEEIVYFQDRNRDTTFVTNQNYNIVFHPSDILTITVSAQDMESVIMFNMPIVGGSVTNGKATGGQQIQDYLIDNEGYIDFPVIGKINISGLNRMEATSLIKSEVEKYIKDPIINIRLVNFKVTILGEVNSPGSYIVKNERITLPEALGLAGDLTISGRRDNVLIMREVNGKQEKVRIDLTKDDIFLSPYYYLSQNDVLYIEPKKAKIRDSSFGTSTSVTISVVSTLISLLAIILR